MYNQSGLLVKFPGLAVARAPRDVFYIYDDFTWYVTAHQWATVDENSGGVTCDDTTSGWVTITTGASDNDGNLIHSGAEVFKLATGKPIIFRARVTLAEANTDDLDFCIGLADNVVIAGAANTALMGDAGGALPADYDGVLFHKHETSLVWNCESSVATTQVTDTSVGAALTAITYLLEFEYDGANTVSFYIDGVQVASQTITAAMLAAADQMCLVAAVKADSAHAHHSSVDYIYCAQLR